MAWLAGNIPDKAFFVYYEDSELSTLAVALLNFPYEESSRWKTELSASAGYQKSLFQQDAKSFLEILNPNNEEKLQNFLNIQRDNTEEQVESAVNYLKLRKVKRLLMQNHADMEHAAAADQLNLLRTHMALKQMEMELTQKQGTVVFR